MITAAPFLFAPFLTLIAAGEATPGNGTTGSACHALRPYPKPYVNIELLVPEPKYELDKTLAQINHDSEASHAAWLNANNLDGLWSYTDLQTQGDTASGWEVSFNFQVYSKPLDSFGAYYCPFIVDVDMAILLQTNIRIAKEYPKGTCRYQAIDDHEYKHFQVNRYVVEQAVERLRADMPKMVTMLEMEGHVGRNDIDARVNVMKQALSDAVKIYIRDEIRRQMNELNAKVDTPAEYDRVSALKKACDLQDQLRAQKRAQSGTKSFSK